MADLNKAAIKRNLVRAHGHGNVQRARYVYEAAAAAQNDVIYLGLLPAYSWVTDFRAINDALGANTGLTFKLVDSSGSDISGGTLATVADTSSAANNRGAFAPFQITEDAYVVALRTGTGSATGTIDAVVDYEYQGV